MNGQLPGAGPGYGGRFGFDRGLGPGYGHFGHGFGHHGELGALEWAMFAMLVAILVLVAALAVSFFARRRGKHRRHGGPPWMLGPMGPFGGPGGRGRLDAQAILAARYARGELDSDEFAKMNEDLRKAAAASPAEPATEPPAPPTATA